MVPEIRKVGPRVTPSRTWRVSMTTLWAATPGTVRLLEHWKQRYLPNTYHAKRAELSRSESKRGLTWHPKLSCKPRSDPCVKTPGYPAPKPGERPLASIVSRLIIIIIIIILLLIIIIIIKRILQLKLLKSCQNTKTSKSRLSECGGWRPRRSQWWLECWD